MSAKKTRILYIEDKSAGLNGPARIGRVTFSKTGQSIHYDGRNFQRLGGGGFKANYFDEATGDHFWISGPRKDGEDRLYPTSTVPVEIDADVAEEYCVIYEADQLLNDHFWAKAAIPCKRKRPRRHPAAAAFSPLRLVQP